METFERLGVAILREIARNDLTLVKHFGRVSLNALCKQYDNLVVPGEPKGSLLRFKVLRQDLFDIARRWRHLAESYQFVESLDRFIVEQKSHALGKSA